MIIRNKFHEVGQNVMSGGRLSECAGEENPCRQAYIDYLGYGLARYIFQLRIFKNDDIYIMMSVCVSVCHEKSSLPLQVCDFLSENVWVKIFFCEFFFWIFF